MSERTSAPLPSAAREWLLLNGVATSGKLLRFPSSTADLYATRSHVLRWYGDSDFLDLEPDTIEKEVAALTALETAPVPAPRLEAWSLDPPAILMTRLPGRHALDAPRPDAIRSLLDAIHAVDPSAFSTWVYRGYHEDVELSPPEWWESRSDWDRAVAVSRARPGSEPAVVIHRDFHPGNILWANGAITGVVDWGNACLGPAPFDLAHYRVNLATLVGTVRTDRLLPGEPVWDVEAALGFIDPWSSELRDNWVGPWPHVRSQIARRRLQDFVRNALARLPDAG